MEVGWEEESYLALPSYFLLCNLYSRSFSFVFN